MIKYPNYIINSAHQERMRANRLTRKSVFCTVLYWSVLCYAQRECDIRTNHANVTQRTKNNIIAELKKKKRKQKREHNKIYNNRMKNIYYGTKDKKNAVRQMTEKLFDSEE